MIKISLPYNFEPREYQKPFCRAWDSFKRIILVAHRRSGKDYTCLSMLVTKAIERVGLYFYIFPTATQGRKIVWNGIDKDGKKFLSKIPNCLIARKNDLEMKIELINGSIIQVTGSDNYDNTIIGTNPVGVIFSEYSLQKPEVWYYVEPILLENGGFAIFNFTPRGKNFAHLLYTKAFNNPNWYVQTLSIDDTGVITKEDIQELRRQGTPESIINQEYYVSFQAFNEHIIYSNEMDTAFKEKRIAPYLYNKSYPLYTSWDLGVRDSMAIVFFQYIANRFIAVDYYENNGRALQYYKEEVLDVYVKEKGYKYKAHFAPHDIKQRDLMVKDENGLAMTRLDGAKKYGLIFTPVKRCFSVWDRINNVREMFHRVFINSDLERLIDALSSYQKRKNESLSTDNKFVYDSEPLHDWSSNAADSFSMGIEAVIQGLVDNKAIDVSNDHYDDAGYIHYRNSPCFIHQQSDDYRPV